MKAVYKIVLGVGFLVLLGVGGFFAYQAISGQLAAVGAADVLPPLATTIPQTTQLPGNLRQYKNADFHFLLNFPDNLQATEYKERDGAVTATFANADNTQSFEVYVTPYGGTQIDATRFKLDEPSGRYLEPQNVVINGAPATLFTGFNPIMGDTREVWFIHGGYLYEVATFKDLDAWLGTIMQSWQFI